MMELKVIHLIMITATIDDYDSNRNNMAIIKIEI